MHCIKNNFSIAELYVQGLHSGIFLEAINSANFCNGSYDLPHRFLI